MKQKRDKQVRLTGQEKMLVEGLRDANLFPLEVVDFLRQVFSAESTNDLIRKSKMEILSKNLAEKFNWKEFFEEV